MTVDPKDTGPDGPPSPVGNPFPPGTPGNPNPPVQAVEIPGIGEEERPPLRDLQIQQILSGLLIPNQGAAKSMAREIIRWRGIPTI